VIVLRSHDPAAEEGLISDISKYANSQNSVKLSDLSANKPFHVKIEQLSLATYCPDGTSRWFYERASGSYNTMLAREGTTPAKLKRLKEDIPASRKISKTDLAKYLNAWDCMPYTVSLGSQKNFEKFMESFSEEDGTSGVELPDGTIYRQLIAKAIIVKGAQKLVRSMFPAFQANIATYTVSVLADRVGERIDLEKIWQAQKISGRLEEQLQIWAKEVNEALAGSAGGRMISEWAKKSECWETVRRGRLSEHLSDLPELK
jgi:hypothetical protein